MIRKGYKDLFYLLLTCVVVMFIWAVAFQYCEVLCEEKLGAGFVCEPKFKESFVWAVVTVTTLGYAGRLPVTNGGKQIAALSALSGMFLYGFLISVFVYRFQHYFHSAQYRRHETLLSVCCCKWRPGGGSSKGSQQDWQSDKDNDEDV